MIEPFKFSKIPVELSYDPINTPASDVGVYIRGPAVYSFAQTCPEYFADEWGRALEMNNEGDVLFNIIPYEAHDISAHSYSGGVFSATTNGSDPWIRFLNQGIATLDLNTTRYGPLKPIDPAKYKILHIRLFSPVPSFFQIFWDKADGGNAITNPIATTAGWAEYEIDLSRLFPWKWATTSFCSLEQW